MKYYECNVWKMNFSQCVCSLVKPCRLKANDTTGTSWDTPGLVLFGSKATWWSKELQGLLLLDSCSSKDGDQRVLTAKPLLQNIISNNTTLLFWLCFVLWISALVSIFVFYPTAELWVKHKTHWLVRASWLVPHPGSCCERTHTCHRQRLDSLTGIIVHNLPPQPPIFSPGLTLENADEVYVLQRKGSGVWHTC